MTPNTTRENVIISGSGSEGLMATALTLYDPVDEVLIRHPGFVLYGPHVRLAGATRSRMRSTRRWDSCRTSTSWRSWSPPRTRAIVVNSPSNPTGGVFPKSIVERILSFAERHDLTVVSDEVPKRWSMRGGSPRSGDAGTGRSS